MDKENGILFSVIKEDIAICHNMDAPGRHHAKWTTPDRRKILHYSTYKQNKELKHAESENKNGYHGQRGAGQGEEMGDVSQNIQNK